MVFFQYYSFISLANVNKYRVFIRNEAITTSKGSDLDGLAKPITDTN